MHGFATLQQMVNQACHQAEGSEAFSPTALQAVHKLNRRDADTFHALSPVVHVLMVVPLHLLLLQSLGTVI